MHFRSMLTNAAASIVVFVLAAPSDAADFSGFRGSAGNGWAEAEQVPVAWSESENIAWKVPLPGRSNGSPIVHGDKVFLTSASQDGKERRLHCFSATDGKQTLEIEPQHDRCDASTFSPHVPIVVMTVNQNQVAAGMLG